MSEILNEKISQVIFYKYIIRNLGKNKRPILEKKKFVFRLRVE